MAPNLAIKSESWLDLSSRGELIQACKLQQSNRRQFERGASVEPSCLGQQERRQSSTTTTTTTPELLSNKNNQHLLIRLRQHAYLARSNSTTLSSSNLSASISLKSELDVCRSGLRIDQCDRNQDRDEREVVPVQQAGSEQPERCRELSFGLRSFRARFEQRARAAASRRSSAAALTGDDNQRSRAEGNDSKQRVERQARSSQSRDASPFARSWSSLSQHLESRLSHLGYSCKNFLYKYQRRRRQGQETANSIGQDRDKFIGLKQQDAFSQNNDQNLFSVKRRLTSDWVARHSTHRDNDALEATHLAAIARCRAASERPKSVQIESWDWRHRPLADDNDAARQTTKIKPRQRANSEFRRCSPSGRDSSTSSSTTLVSETERIRSAKKTRNQTRSKKRIRKDNNNQQVCNVRREADEANSSSTTTSTMSSGGQQQQGRHHLKAMQQQLMPPATSDYWSGGATTATASEFELLSSGRNMSASAGERLVGVGQLPLDTADQDYYLDVASAASMLPQGALAGSRAPVAHLMHPHDMNQQQQLHLMHQLQQEQMVFATAELEADYDDYAVPSDENGCRLDRSQVELVRLIGEGQKGFVFLGKLQSRDGSTLIDVAIKTLKYETEQLIERLMAEAATMKQLEHPHIIKFIGMCPETPALIAMELAQFGELKHYLKINRHLIKCSQLVLFTFQISTALSYLESKNYVHRDVAARNVLVCSHNCVKLADFGLSRNLQNLHAPQKACTPTPTPTSSSNLLLAPPESANGADQSLYVAAPRGKLPVRWLAPESLVFRRFTSASDVWMFAVCAWELFHFGQLRPWPQLRNQQVLLAIESGQRPQRPPACPERLYALMLKCWSYAPVQRPKFREIKQCIWSIYLNERTREQVEFERLEQVRQKYLLMARQQQQQQQQQVAMMQHQQQHPSQQPQQMLMSYSTPSNYSSAATTDNEQSTSPCSSAFNSMGRANNARLAAQQQQQQQRQQKMHQQAPVQQQQQQQQQNQQALQSQLSRFKQRQTPADFRPHVLQKQRSQGAIGLSTAQQKQREAEEDRDKSFCRHSVAADRRRVTRAHDDQAIELAKRRSGTDAAHQLHRPAPFESDQDDEDDDDDEEEEDSVMGSPTMLAPQSGRATRQLPFASGRVMSASPALTVDNARSQSRMVSLEPAYDGLFTYNQLATSGDAPFSSRPTSRAGGGQVAMLRANFDLGDNGGGGGSSSSRVSPVFTTSPALTTINSNPPTRPVSWRNSSELHAGAANQQQQQQQQQQTNAPKTPKQPADQLGQMLQALRITPMKAKLTKPPEQSVRVLQRESSKSPSKPAPRRPEVSQQPQSRVKQEHPEVEVDEHSRQLMLHQRLLGRIRPSSIVSDPRAGTPTGRPESSARLQPQQVVSSSSSSRARQLMNQKSVEAVDHSLQILESLMSNSGGPNSRHTSQTTTSTLPRKRTAR